MTPAPNLTHIALHVRDLTASLSFYVERCRLTVVNDRHTETGRVVWLAEAGREARLIFVLIEGGEPGAHAVRDVSHFGFAMNSRAEVDEIARDAEQSECLAWPPRDTPYPTGYHCGLSDPDGNLVEFSYGQPLGPGAPTH